MQVFFKTVLKDLWSGYTW